MACGRRRADQLIKAFAIAHTALGLRAPQSACVSKHHINDVRRARRRQVVEMIVMETNRLHQARDSRVQRMLRTTLKTLAAQLAELE
jgi:hypothetical protein